jgi:hypothetical protein
MAGAAMLYVALLVQRRAVANQFSLDAAMGYAIIAFLFSMYLVLGLTRLERAVMRRGNRSHKLFSFPILLAIAFVASAALAIGLLRFPDAPTEQDTFRFWAALENGAPTSEIQAMLDEHPSLATKHLFGNRLPIVLATSLKRSDLVSLLLERGADPNARDGSGWPLMAAAYGNDVATGRILLEHGADPEQSGFLGMKPLHVCQDETHREFRALLENHGKNPGEP